MFRVPLPTWQRAAPWLALAAVWLLFELPNGVRNSSYELKVLRPSGDFLALVTVWQVGKLLGFPRAARVLTWLVAGLLVLFRIDTAIFGAIMNEEPLLYDQLFVLRHTLVLISDLWSWTTLLVLSGTLLMVVGSVWLSLRLLRVAERLFAPERAAQTWRTWYVLWLVALLLSVSDALGVSKRPLVRWTAPVLAGNIVRSRETYVQVNKGVGTSPYHADLAKVRLTRKPDVMLILVESYGRLMFSHRELSSRHRQFTEALTQRLSLAGYHAASAYTKAPVRGGRSWLAEASLLVGTEVRYEAVLAQIVDNIDKVAHIPGFLERQGYETILLAPADRERSGVGPVVNRYGYDRLVTFTDLNYHGPVVGWGIIPDQYSLEYTNEHVLAAAQKPLFLNFHMVTSHAPWRQVPELVDDYRELGRGNVSHDVVASKQPEQAVINNLRHYEHEQRRGNYREMKPLTRRGYESAVRYDLELLARFMEQDHKDRIYIILGDHQPPLLGTDDSGFDSPMHVVARDPKLLEEFYARGFLEGFTLPGSRGAALWHSGLLSLLTRALVRCCGEGPLPPFRREGFTLLKK